jgi:hypothetical protein
MEIIDHSPYPLKEGKLSLVDRFRGSLDFGLSWYPQMQAQAVLLSSLSRLLSDQYIALNNITLSDVDVAIPVIIIGPTGLQVLYVTSLGGVYRAKEENWLVQDSSRGFKVSKPNLLTRSLLMGRAVEVFLKRNGLEVQVQTALVFVSPHMFVETIRPPVRVILSDAIEKFIVSFSQNRTTLDQDAVRRAADLLTNPIKVEVESAPVDLREELAPPPVKKRNKFLAAFGKVNLSRKQWTIILVLQVLLICLLMTFIAAFIFMPY